VGRQFGLRRHDVGRDRVDGMGDDQPPGELNQITKPGQNFGFPWFGGGAVRYSTVRTAPPPNHGKPKFWPGLVIWFSSPGGWSSPAAEGRTAAPRR
jgi:glucose/arabinose dehydrogenase